MKKSLVLEVNKEYGLRNIITGNLWYNKDIKDLLIDRINYYNDMNNFLENDMNYNDIKEFLKDYIISFENKKTFDSFIKRLKELNCNKSMTNKKLLEVDGLNTIFKDVKEIHLFILNKIVPIAKEL